MLILLLLVFSSNNFSYEVYSSGGTVQATATGSYGPDNNHIHKLSFSKPTLKKEHQRVRYMGGECSYVAPGIVFVPKTVAYTAQKHELFSSSFIADTCPVLFKLRGPPSFYCTAC